MKNLTEKPKNGTLLIMNYKKEKIRDKFKLKFYKKENVILMECHIIQ